MLEQPENVDHDQIVDQLSRHWGIRTTSVQHALIGQGSVNWIATESPATNDSRRRTGDRQWFVKLDAAAAADFFDVTYQTAAELRDANLQFVNAAVPALNGRLRQRVTENWDMAVFRFIDGRNPEFLGPERAGIAEVIGRLHAHDRRPSVAFDWEPGYRQPELRTLLANDLGRPWTSGPYGERARALIERCTSGIERLFARHDRYLDRLRVSDVPWVVTHGEPHDGNTMLDGTGQFHLIDCNAMMMAPPERDLRLLLHGSHQRPLGPFELGLANTEVLAAYRGGLRAGGADPVRTETEVRDFVLEFYRAEWHLAEISSYARRLRDPHQEDRDGRNDWHYLNQYLPVSQNWPELATRA